MLNGLITRWVHLLTKDDIFFSSAKIINDISSTTTKNLTSCNITLLHFFENFLSKLKQIFLLVYSFNFSSFFYINTEKNAAMSDKNWHIETDKGFF